MKSTFVVLCAFAVLAITSAKKCPALNGTTNLDFEGLTGDWYVYKSIGDSLTEKWFRRCPHVSITVDEKTNNIYLTKESTLFLFGKKVKTTKTTQKIVYVDVPNGAVKAESTSWPHSQTTYTVLAVDYNNWAIFWDCHNVLWGGLPYSQNSWILLRNKPENVDNFVLSKIEDALNKNGLQSSQYHTTSFKNC